MLVSKRIEKKKNFGKNPFINTSHLPDTEREEKMKDLRLKLVEEYKEMDQKIQNEFIEIKYFYWDAPNNEYCKKIKKNTLVKKFIEIVQKELKPEFFELRNLDSNDILLILANYILPYDVSFYDLIKREIK